MYTDENISKSKSSLIVLIIVLAVYSILVISANHYERMTADSTLYINIAEKYIKGDFSNAVNGYWGPMLSWLLIPFLYFGSSHVFAINALNLIVGVFAIIGVWILSFRFEIAEIIRSAILVSLLPIILFFSVVELFDFLLLCILVYYLGIVFNNEYPKKLYYGAICGLLGAFAYFTKSYAFLFFIAHFTVINAAHYIRCSEKQDRKNVLRNAVAGILLFTIMSGIWIAVISHKYNKITFSNHNKTAIGVLGPGTTGEGFEFGWPIFHEGFFEPPNKTAISAWEDPSYIKVNPWSPWDSSNSFKYFIKHVIRNILDGLSIFESFSRLSTTIVIAYILLFLVQPFNRKVLRGDMFYSFFTMVLYTGGYALFHFEARYMWIINVSLLLMGGYILTILFQNDFFKSNLRKNILIVFFALSFMISPLKSFSQISKDNINKEMYLLSTELRGKYNIKGNIASNREWKHIAIHDSWHKTFRLAYWLNSRYYGQAKKDISDIELESELKKYNIEYYIFWGEPGDIPESLFRYKEITNGEIPGLRIYSLNEKSNNNK